MSTLWNGRFKPVRKLSDTLQGEIWRAQDLNDNNRSVVVKTCDKSLVRSKRSRDGHMVHEDIQNEIKILTHLSNQPHRDDGFCYLIDHWETHHAYFYAMEFCEAELFNFISNSFTQNGIMHNFMLTKMLQTPQIPCDVNSKHEWLHKVRAIFRQMVKCVYYMHSKGVCHMDLSLENTLIYNINEKLCWGYCRTRAAPYHVPSDVVQLCLKFSNLCNAIQDFRAARIKIIDFGLAKYFPHYKTNKKRETNLIGGYIRNLSRFIAPIFYQSCFNSEVTDCCIRFHGGLQNFFNNKRVGKISYMAPEVYNRFNSSSSQVYDARSADIWSLGIILFMMTIGAPPYKRPIVTDNTFNFIINGRIEDVLRQWKRLSLISTDVLDLMKKMFKYEIDRISMEELIRHPFVDLIDELKIKKQQKLIYVTEEKTLIEWDIDNKYDDDENMKDMYDGAGIRDEDIHIVEDEEVVMDDGIHVRRNENLTDLQNTEREIQMVDAVINAENEIQTINAVMSIDDLIQTFSQ